MGAAETFHQRDWAAKLRVPEGMEFVRADSAEAIRKALSEGRAAYVQSCEGRAFVWKDGASCKVDHFFFGPPNTLEFPTEDEAVDYAASFCD